MAGSIVARNRNIAIRATFPLAVGITAGWMLIPYTMRNTADLIWEYEKKVPAIADTHLEIRKAAQQAWGQTKVQTESLRRWADQTATQSRARVEQFVEKGK
jgi:organizing structure protein 2